MPEVVAYLAFDGNCAEAMRFYEPGSERPARGDDERCC